MPAHPDRAVDRKKLAALMPDRALRRIVKQLPGCACCDDVLIDTAVRALLHVIAVAAGTQNEEWRVGALNSCKRVLDHYIETPAEVAAEEAKPN